MSTTINPDLAAFLGKIARERSFLNIEYLIEERIKVMEVNAEPGVDVLRSILVLDDLDEIHRLCYVHLGDHDKVAELDQWLKTKKSRRPQNKEHLL